MHKGYKIKKDKLTLSDISENLQDLSNLSKTKAIKNNSPSSNFKPSKEQEEILITVQNGKSLNIVALAGTGKTTTLEFLTNNFKKKYLYIAFNKKIVEEAKSKFPYHVECRTSHSLAYSAMHRMYSSEKLAGLITGPLLVKKLKIENLVLSNEKVLNRYKIGDIIAKILDNFCNSADKNILHEHFPKDAFDFKNNSFAPIVDKLISITQDIWKLMLEKNDDLPLGHNGYLKAWQLKQPEIQGYDCILLDEAQDTNACVLDIFEKQTCQKIIVGDPYQTIFEWRGALGHNNFNSSIETKFLTGSFRFNNEIASLANSILKKLKTDAYLEGKAKGLTFGKGIVSIEDEHNKIDAIVCSSNLSAVLELIQELENDRRACILGGSTEIIEYIQDAISIIDHDAEGTSKFFKGIKGKSELIEYLKNKALDNNEVTRFLDIIGMPDIISKLSQSNAFLVNPDVIVSTVWKVKGKEWKTIKVDRGIATTLNYSEATKEDLMLAYVAFTRAMEQIILPLNNSETIEFKNKLLVY